MTKREEQVASLIRAAFSGVALGKGVGMWQAQGLDDYAGTDTLIALREKDEKRDWSTINAADLDRCNSSLSFFDAEGMRFHLPAYLIADLAGKLKCADVLFHLVHPTGYGVGESRFRELSATQRNAVREFLLLRAATADDFTLPLITKALSEYWTGRKQ